MIVHVNEKKEVDIDVIEVYVKCTDRFCGFLRDSNGAIVIDYEDTYVPDFFPGNHNNEYLQLCIELKTGQILNWKPISRKALEQHIKEYTDND